MSFRILLNRGLILNSLQLCSTSIEKLFKCVFNLVLPESSKCFSHNVLKIYHKFKEEIQYLNIYPNEDFLRWISSIYSTRYSSDVYSEESYDFFVRHLLAEVDKMFYDFFSVCDEEGEFRRLFFENRHIEDIRYLNFIFLNEDRSEFVKRDTAFVSILFRGNFPKVGIAKIKSCGSVTGFSRGLSVLRGDIVHFQIDVGTLEPMDLPPSYWLKR